MTQCGCLIVYPHVQNVQRQASQKKRRKAPAGDQEHTCMWQPELEEIMQNSRQVQEEGPHLMWGGVGSSACVLTARMSARMSASWTTATSSSGPQMMTSMGCARGMASMVGCTHPTTISNRAQMMTSMGCASGVTGIGSCIGLAGLVSCGSTGACWPLSTSREACSHLPEANTVREC